MMIMFREELYDDNFERSSVMMMILKRISVIIMIPRGVLLDVFLKKFYDDDFERSSLMIIILRVLV